MPRKKQCENKGNKMKKLILVSAMLLSSVSVMAANNNSDNAKKLYVDNCQSCHGIDRLGAMGPALFPENLSRLRKHKAVNVIKNRKSPVQSWFLDQSLVMSYWSGEGKRSYHHTAPVNSLYALHESLVHLHNEGLENSWARHKAQHKVLAEGLAKLGIKFIVPEADRLPQLNAIYIPEGVDDAKVRNYLLNHYNLEIGAGLGDFAGKAWRIGLMGYAARNENVALCLAALTDALNQ